MKHHVYSTLTYTQSFNFRSIVLLEIMCHKNVAGWFVPRWSPIQVLTGPAVEQLRWFDTTRCCYATPPTKQWNGLNPTLFKPYNAPCQLLTKCGRVNVFRFLTGTLCTLQASMTFIVPS